MELSQDWQGPQGEGQPRQVSSGRADSIKILVLNLERSRERRARIAASMSAQELEPEFLPGVDGTSNEHVRYPQYDLPASVRFFGQVLTPGEFGCFASHHLAWQRCLEENVPYVICEDDIQLLPSFPLALEAVRPLLDELHLVRLFGLNSRRRFKTVRALPHGFELIRYLRGPAGMQCYALSPRGAATLLEHCPLWLEPADRFLDRFWLHGLGHYAVRPFPITLGGEPSDIGVRRRRKTIYTIPRKLLRGLDHLARITYNLRHP